MQTIFLSPIQKRRHYECWILTLLCLRGLILVRYLLLLLLLALNLEKDNYNIKI